MPIASLAEFVDAVAQIVDEWTPPDVDWYLQPWFRGHGDASWSLDPSWYRSSRNVSGVGAEYYSEQTLLERFRLRAPTYLDRLPASDWEWLFLMQHYGLPTRLLDWTESALIALYFALRDNKGKRDAAVWVLSPWWLNRETLGEYMLLAADDPHVSGHGPLAPGRELEGRMPLAITPIHSSPRIAAQRGVFTIHGTERGALNRLARRTKERPSLRRLVIPKKRIFDLKTELAVSGITESLVFPELTGLCREMTNFFFGE